MSDPPLPELAVPSAEFERLADEVLRAGNLLRFRARGRSMQPFIRDGDVLTVAPVRPFDLRVGDVALHRTRGGGLAAHRVLRIVSRNGTLAVQTRGDSLGGARETVRPAEVLGRVVSLARGNRITHLHGAPSRVAGLLWAAGQSGASFRRRLLFRLRKILIHAVSLGSR